LRLIREPASPLRTTGENLSLGELAALIETEAFYLRAAPRIARLDRSKLTRPALSR
jgi:hypothetical protein